MLKVIADHDITQYNLTFQNVINECRIGDILECDNTDKDIALVINASALTADPFHNSILIVKSEPDVIKSDTTIRFRKLNFNTIEFKYT